MCKIGYLALSLLKKMEIKKEKLFSLGLVGGNK